MNNLFNNSKRILPAFVIMFIFVTTGFCQQDNMASEEMSVLKTFDDKSLAWGPCPPFMPEGCSIAVLHGDPSKPNVDVLFKVPANYDIPNHYHSSPERMVLVSGELLVTYEGEAPKLMKVGNYAYGPTKKPHVATCADGDPCIIFIAFEEPLDAFPFVAKK